MEKHKFTEKALECCIKPTSDCDNCPLYVKGDGDCVTIVKQNALDITRKQDKKIEALLNSIKRGE